MLTDGPIDTSASSRAELNGVMVVGNVTTIAGKPKTLYITGAFYTTLDTVMGVFKYFNVYNYTIEPESRFFIHMTVALFDAVTVSKAGVVIDAADEYDLMGDIYYLSPANDAPAKHAPVVRVCGRPSKIILEMASFEIDVNQWVSFQGEKAAFLWSGTIPDAWRQKPTPNPNSPKFVSVSGVLDSMRIVGTSKRFHVTIASVTFLGSAPYTAPALTPTPKGKRKAGISFEDKPT